MKDVKDLIAEKDKQSVDLLAIIDLLHELNGMDNAGDDLIKLLWKLEIDIFSFTTGLDEVEKKHDYNKNVTEKSQKQPEKDKIDHEIKTLWSKINSISTDKDLLKSELYTLTDKQAKL